MTDKDRLEEIKKRLNSTMLFTGRINGKNQIVKDIAWILEQAEQLNGTKYRHGFKEMYAICNKDYAILHAQNQRYKQALEFYADEENYKENLISKAEQIDGNWVEPAHYEPPIIYFDKGQIARQALEGET